MQILKNLFSKKKVNTRATITRNTRSIDPSKFQDSLDIKDDFISPYFFINLYKRITILDENTKYSSDTSGRFEEINNIYNIVIIQFGYFINSELSENEYKTEKKGELCKLGLILRVLRDKILSDLKDNISKQTNTILSYVDFMEELYILLGVKNPYDIYKWSYIESKIQDTKFSNSIDLVKKYYLYNMYNALNYIFTYTIGSTKPYGNILKEIKYFEESSTNISGFFNFRKIFNRIELLYELLYKYRESLINRWSTDYKDLQRLRRCLEIEGYNQRCYDSEISKYNIEKKRAALFDEDKESKAIKTQ